ncbi:hypothetical protein C0989_000448 [Termitomyces sp. Mn162]|nr:hypothetical protein C0989_000448 [Termitomyces sp. Mn162]
MKVSENDPFAIFITPPENETPAEKSARERRETEEKRISDRIDEEIKAEKAAMKKQRAVVKVLLLGQSESGMFKFFFYVHQEFDCGDFDLTGKSTTLKNFRMKYARAAWKVERLSWRVVIQLNLIRSIITIVEALQAEMDGEPIRPLPVPRPPLTCAGKRSNAPPPRKSIDSEFLDSDMDTWASEPIRLTDKHELLKLRLGPLRRVETDLKRRLGAGTEEIVGGGGGVLGEDPVGRTKEFGVQGWKHMLEGPLAALSGNSQHNSREKANAVDDATEVIAECKQDMGALWVDPTVKAVLKRRRIRLEDSAGLYVFPLLWARNILDVSRKFSSFLDDLDRIATKHYEPTDDDIVRARLRTLGIQEYKIEFEQNNSLMDNVGLTGNFGQEWKLYDVGGARTVRNAWLPYFEGVNAIIFRAYFHFDYAFLVTYLVLLFIPPLAGGMQFQDPREDDNDPIPQQMRYFAEETQERCSNLKDKFRDTLRQHSPEPRVSYFYATSVTDTKATATTLKTVRDSILREHLKDADFV